MNELLQILSIHSPNLVGFILPPIIEILNKDIAADKMVRVKIFKFSFEVEEKFLATLAICMSVAFLLNASKILTGNVDDAVASFGLIFTESQAVYRLYFKDSWLRDKIQERVIEQPDPLLDDPRVLG